MTILVTGAAGFIGAATAEALIERGDQVIGVDNLSDYYDVSLKQARLARLEGRDGFRFERMDISDRAAMRELFATHRPERVLHLAAQASVRYGSINPYAYADSNLSGFLNVLEGCRHGGVRHLVFASSSSVYGANTHLPYSAHDNVDHPLSLYAATKKANEAMAHAYAHLYRIPVTGLRFFTVYGPWGRPDMSPYIFTKRILAGDTIEIFNNGDHARDFTYIDDIVDGVLRVLDRPARGSLDWDGGNPDPATSRAPYRLYNIGNNHAVPLMEFISHIEAAVGRKAVMTMLPMQPGDVRETWADIDDLATDTGFAPRTCIAEGIRRFVAWYREYHGA